jgi:hypothetical protein
MRINRFVRALLLAAFAAGSVAAQSSGGTRWDLTAGAGNDLVSVSASALRFPATALGGRIQAGLGARLTFASGDVALTPAGAKNVPAGVIDTLYLSAAAAMLNLSGNLAVRLGGRLEAGLNIDLAGAGFGAERDARYRSTASAPRSSEKASPSAGNVFLYGSKDRGSLNSEFFGAWQATERLTLRAGLSHQLVEYSADRTLSSNTKRFRSYTNLVFVGVRMAR